MKTAKEILDEIKATEELKSRGWEKVPCSKCKGTGYEQLDWSNVPVGCRVPDNTCPDCCGDGGVWTHKATNRTMR